MRRFLTLICLLCLAIPAGISISGCTRDPGVNYCNGQGYGMKITDVAVVSLSPATTGISMTYGQTRQVSSPSVVNCKGTSTSSGSVLYGTSNNQLVDITPNGSLCAGTWNRNSGGGIANYTICSPPNPLPSTGGLPYATAYITATEEAVVSNPVQVFVHPPVTAVSLVTTPLNGSSRQCFSQGQTTTLDAQACITEANNQKYLLCAPSSVTSAASPSLACPLPYVNGTSGPTVPLSSIPNCTSSIGVLTYSVGNASVASINTDTTTNQVSITAGTSGTTTITSSVAGSGSTAGYFSACPPKSISLTLANSKTSGTINKGVTQNLVTTVIDTQGNPINGLSLDYQSTDPIDITAASGGSITTSFPGVASVYAICQPATCNPSPIDQIGLFGTGLPLSSNPVTINSQGAASDYLWFGAPGQSQYIYPFDLLTGTAGSAAFLPYVPNSMVMDRLGEAIYMGSSHELMVFNTSSSTLSGQNTNLPGVVLAVSPDSSTVLVNDQSRQLFYVYSSTGGVETFSGMGAAAAWTPDSKTLYITDSAALNAAPENVAAGITTHTDTLYIYNQNTGWTTHALPCSVYDAINCPTPSTGATNLAITIPSVGAYLSGTDTVVHTWCPTGTGGNYATLSFYPQSDSIAVQTDVLAATTDGQHILGAAFDQNTGEITLSDIGVSIPTTALSSGIDTPNACSVNANTLSALSTDPWLNTAAPLTLDSNDVVATGVNQVVASPASNLAFITYTAAASNTKAALPYYQPNSTATSSNPQAGTLEYLKLTAPASGAAPSAPLAGAFTPDETLFFVSTAGDNMVHFISIPPVISASTPPTDTQQISPNLPACTPPPAGVDQGCTYTGVDKVVPATVIAVKPRTSSAT